MKKICMAFVALACLLSSGLAFADVAGYELTIDADGTLTGWAGTLPEELVLPDTVTNIGESAFEKCVNLRKVTLPEGLKSISPFAFYGCSNLTSVAIPASVENIGESAFHGCSSLTTVGLFGGLLKNACPFEPRDAASAASSFRRTRRLRARALL